MCNSNIERHLDCEKDKMSPIVIKNNLGALAYCVAFLLTCLPTPNLGLYSFSGVQVNLPIAYLTSDGWQQCFSDLYSGTDSLSAVQSACSDDYVLVACRSTGGDTLIAAAYALRTVVFDDIGSGETSYISSNGKILATTRN